MSPDRIVLIDSSSLLERSGIDASDWLPGNLVS